MPRTLLDLSHIVSPGMTTDPRLPAPVVRDVWTRVQSGARYAPGVSFQIASVELVQNTGTYLDAPFHRHEGRPGVWDLPIERVADLPGVCIDLRERKGRRSIGIDDLSGLDPRGRAVLLCTGDDRRWGTDAYADNSHRHLTGEAAEWLVARGAALVGVDAINADDFADLARPVHTILLGAGVPIVENLVGLDRLVGRPFRFTAAPVKVEGLGSFPVRAFAVVEP